MIKGALGEITGTRIVESGLVVKGIGVQKQGENLVYLSKHDYSALQNAKSSEEIESIMRGIKIIEVKGFLYNAKPDLKI